MLYVHSDLLKFLIIWLERLIARTERFSSSGPFGYGQAGPPAGGRPACFGMGADTPYKYVVGKLARTTLFLR